MLQLLRASAHPQLGIFFCDGNTLLYHAINNGFPFIRKDKRKTVPILKNPATAQPAYRYCIFFVPGTTLASM